MTSQNRRQTTKKQSFIFKAPQILILVYLSIHHQVADFGAFVLKQYWSLKIVIQRASFLELNISFCSSYQVLLLKRILDAIYHNGYLGKNKLNDLQLFVVTLSPGCSFLLYIYIFRENRLVLDKITEIQIYFKNYGRRIYLYYHHYLW